MNYHSNKYCYFYNIQLPSWTPSADLPQRTCGVCSIQYYSSSVSSVTYEPLGKGRRTLTTKSDMKEGM